MKKLASSLFLLASILHAAALTDNPKQLSLTDGEKTLMTYQAGYLPSPEPEAPWFGRSGFIHPVYTPKGRIVTDDFPADLTHQHGLMFAWTSAEFEGQPVDFWNSKKLQGRIEHVKTVQADSDTIIVELQHLITLTEEPIPAIKEQWRLQRVPHPTMHVFDLVSTQTCIQDEPLKIRKYHYGGMCLRGPANWDSGENMLTSEGKTQAEGNHSRPGWVTLIGPVEGEPCGIAMMSHPDNFRAPQPVRLHPKIPYFCFAPMVLGEFQLEPGKPYISRFRVVAYDGEPNPEALQTIWQEYAAAE